jgi:excisionase family DNA binding protein
VFKFRRNRTQNRSATARGYASALKVSQVGFYALVKEGELSVVKIGRRSFVQAEELDEFVRRNRI